VVDRFYAVVADGCFEAARGSLEQRSDAIIETDPATLVALVYGRPPVRRGAALRSPEDRGREVGGGALPHALSAARAGGSAWRLRLAAPLGAAVVGA